MKRLSLLLLLLAGCVSQPKAPAPAPTPPLPPVTKRPAPAALARPMVAAAPNLVVITNPNPSTVTLGWDKSPTSTVTSYWLYRGPASRTYTNSINVGLTNQTRITVPGGSTTFFSVTASDGLLQSDFSNELIWTPTITVQKKTVLKITGTVDASPDMNTWAPVYTFPAVYLTNVIDPGFLEFYQIRAQFDHWDVFEP